jgi:hypothetical protein
MPPVPLAPLIDMAVGMVVDVVGAPPVATAVIDVDPAVDSAPPLLRWPDTPLLPALATSAEPPAPASPDAPPVVVPSVCDNGLPSSMPSNDAQPIKATLVAATKRADSRRNRRRSRKPELLDDHQLSGSL